MNYLYNLDLAKFHSNSPTLPMSQFFNKYEMDINIKTCKKVEDLICKYSIKLYQYNTMDTQEDNNYFLLRKDFDDIISDIRRIKISKNYLGLFSWIIDRSFRIYPGTLRNQYKIISNINKNRSIVIKVLYDINPANLLKCFSKNC